MFFDAAWKHYGIQTRFPNPFVVSELTSSQIVLSVNWLSVIRIIQEPYHLHIKRRHVKCRKWKIADR